MVLVDKGCFFYFLSSRAYFYWEKLFPVSRKWIKLLPGDEEPFSIKLSKPIEMVDDLKKAIKKEKKNALHEVDANEIYCA